ncbi:protein kinase IKS1 Ecym_6294 [Eremothecium cymbalariae DBVPG|uniref:Protein kinase domain-containing protein n=1 Tax=Eremothecium cymbalariae (strain CBS 270.75 / DBVPG 7215 / KCTC 17166 / NRRL Y-17582) TaxID=931890 RepID=G8JU94_ERECY|nr:hypothetical protein Ecym_6294 [Eremothecium cymbalariae DBVPG\
MSLVLYNRNIQNDTSIILHDPSTRSLVLFHEATGSISLTSNLPVRQKRLQLPAIGSHYGSDPNRCPNCGNIINPPSYFIHENYFQLLQDIPRTSSNGSDGPLEGEGCIPYNLFTQGYYNNFFHELEMLGNGARGSVFKVEHTLLDHSLGLYALKKIPIGNDVTWLNKCIQEVKFMTSITQDCLHLVKYNHVWLEKTKSFGLVTTRNGTNKQDNSVCSDVPFMFILEQFCLGGNLEGVVNEQVFHKLTGKETPEDRKRLFKMKKKGAPLQQLGLTTFQILSIASDLAHGLQELHSLDIIHRDLKPSNCLLLDVYKTGVKDNFPKVLIGDFGESQLRGQLRTATGATGTLEFTAPELLIFEDELRIKVLDTSAPQFTFESDMYSLGMILYYVVFGELPFKSGLEMRKLKSQIKQYTCSTKDLHKRHQELNLLPIDIGIFDLISHLMSPVSSNRPSATETISTVQRLAASQEAKTMAPTLKQDGDRGLIGRAIFISTHLALSIVYYQWRSSSSWNFINLVLLGFSFNCQDFLRPYIITLAILLFLL